MRFAVVLLAPLMLAAVGAWAGGGTGAVTGVVAGAMAHCARVLLERLAAVERLGTVLGMVAGGLVASVAIASLGPLWPVPALPAVIGLGLLIAGAQIGRRIARELGGTKEPEEIHTRDRVLDTSAIIDARLPGIAVAGFLDGRLVVPAFVLRELQAVADSSDAVKRTRGRMGLDALQKLRERSDLEVLIVDSDPAREAPVDEKLVAFALGRGARIVTTDYNLNKVAGLHGVEVVNVNDLATALKPVVTAGEMLHLALTRKGTERGQGVGYLDDGTMVVVDGGQESIGREVECVVTSVHQSSAGKMVFARRAGNRLRSGRSTGLESR